MSIDPTANTAERLRQLLRELYVSGAALPEWAPEAEQERLLDIARAASDGEPFEDLGLPFPRRYD